MALNSCSPLARGILALLLLHDCLCAAPKSTHSLSYDFTINPKPAPGQPWCEVHSQVDQKPFYSYDCGTGEVKTMSVLGEQVHATQDWEEQKEALRDMGDILKRHLDDIRAENYTTKDPLTLQGRMFCQQKASGCTSGSWEFGFSGQMSLLFNSDNKKWRELRPGSRWLREKWENDKHMTSFLHTTSVGDCRSWLQGLLAHWGGILEPTANSTTALEMAKPTATAIMPSPGAQLVILTGSILVGIYRESIGMTG